MRFSAVLVVFTAAALFSLFSFVAAYDGLRLSLVTSATVRFLAASRPPPPVWRLLGWSASMVGAGFGEAGFARAVLAPDLVAAVALASACLVVCDFFLSVPPVDAAAAGFYVADFALN